VTGDRIGRRTPGGLSESLTPEVRGGLAAIGRVSRALVGAGSLPDLAGAALTEMRHALGLSVAALYLPTGIGPSLVRLIDSTGPGGAPRARERIDLDEEAWRLAMRSGTPLVFQEPAAWFAASPFEPPADSWLVLPLWASESPLGIVAAASPRPLALDAASAAVLALLGDLVGAGIATARLREEVHQAELERERMRLAADVHDGLAQDLVVARREVALLGADPAPEVAAASRARLGQAIASAHEVVRSRLAVLVAPGPPEGLRPAVEATCRRFADRGLPVTVTAGGPLPPVPAQEATVALRVLCEALANAEQHAQAGRVDVELRVRDRRLVLAVTDDGRGFAPPGPRGDAAGHLGLRVMHERARAADGTLTVTSRPRSGTRVVLELPLPQGPE
jgi:signal transduction histidine kinase